MAITPPPSPPLLKAMVFRCWRFQSRRISSLTHRNDMNITLTQFCRDERLKDAMHILLTTNTEAHYSLHSSTLLQLLQTCIAKNALPEGKLLHSIINRIGLQFDPSTNKFLQNRLIHMYVNCGSLADAREVFDWMPERDIFSWNMIISGYQKHGFPRQALSLFHQMPHQNEVSWNAMIIEYSKNGFSEKARELFDKMPHRDAVSWNAMVAGYAQNGHVERARELFDNMPHRNVVSWNVMIAGYAQNEFSEKALQTFKQMQLSGVKPNSLAFASILSACATMGALEEGMDIHQRVVENGFSSNIVVVNALIDMYGKCGRIHKARELFEKMHDADTVSWTAMIAGYAQNGYVERARELFDKMPHRNEVSWNAMIAGYAQNGYVERARELFDKIPHRNVVSWTAMIAGYAENGFAEEALEAFKQMQLSRVEPDSATFATILPAFANMGALEEGMDIHQRVVEKGFSSNFEVVSALIDMYAKCGRIHKGRELFDKMHDGDIVSWTSMIAGYAQNGYLERAHELFDKMPCRDAVSWTSMIAGYAKNGFSEKALETFKQMQLSGIKPNSATFASIISACATVGALEEGMNIHQRVVENGFSSNIVVVNALIDMYAKCGRLHKARELFDKMHDADTVLWATMIGGYAIHGYSRDALKLFDLMKHLGTNPDSITFVCVLLACSHAGLVDEGCKYFNSMSDSYCIIPGIYHYTCIVDLLGRAGYLEEALNFIVKIPIKPDSGVWMCLLGACRSHKNVGTGEFVATILFLLEPKNASSCVLLSNIYAELGSWNDVQRIRTLMKDGGIKKTPRCSWIEVDKRVHAFLVGDRSHPQTKEIYEKLEKLSSEMKAAGYIPNTIPALHDVEADAKELLLDQHSERLAIAFGLLKTPPGTIIRVVKNLQVCDDCHTVIKFISKIVARDIVVRDANRFHHFKHGECSCGDYW